MNRLQQIKEGISSFLGSPFTQKESPSVQRTIQQEIEMNRYYQSILRTALANQGFTSDISIKEMFEKAYGKSIDVYSIVNRIAEVTSSIPWKIYDIRPNGEKIEVKEGRFYDLIHCPNRLDNGQEFREAAAINLLVSGNTYISGERSIGFDGVREMNVLPSNCVEIIFGDGTKPINGYRFERILRQEYEPDEVIHIKYFNPVHRDEQSLYGLSPLFVAASAYETGIDKWIAQANMLKNRGAAGILTNRTERSMRPDDADELEKKVKSRLGTPEKFNSVTATTANVDYIQLGLSASDLELIRQGIIVTRAICNVYNVNSSLFNDPENKTYNNQLEAKKSMYTDAVIPLDNKIRGKLNSSIFVQEWRDMDGRNYMIEQDTSGIEVLQEDKKKKSESEARTSREVRELLKAIGDGKVTPEQAMNTLQVVHGMSEGDAERIVLGN